MTTGRKRGRPPKTFPSSWGTKITLRDIGMTRKQVSDAIAVASLPEDVFEAELARDDQRPSVRALVNLARNLPRNHRPGSPLTEALRVALRLSPADRHALCLAIMSGPEEAIAIADRLRALQRSTDPEAPVFKTKGI